MDGDNGVNGQLPDLEPHVIALAERLQLPHLPAETLANVVDSYKAIIEHGERLAAWQERARK